MYCNGKKSSKKFLPNEEKKYVHVHVCEKYVYNDKKNIFHTSIDLKRKYPSP